MCVSGFIGNLCVHTLKISTSLQRQRDRETREVEGNYIQVNSTNRDQQRGFHTALNAGAELQPSPSFPSRFSLQPSIPSILVKGKTRLRAAGARCQMCQVIPGDRLRIKEHGVQRGKSMYM